MSIDVVVLLTIAAGTIASSVWVRRRGARGASWLLATWVVFFGLVLTTMMVAHSIEIVDHLVRGDMRVGGEPWAYDFHFYGLQLLGAVLAWQGIQCLRVAGLVSTGDPRGRHIVRRAALLSLAVAAPLVPIQPVFGAIISVLSAITVGLSMRPSGEVATARFR
jgi:hypothetical protein